MNNIPRYGFNFFSIPSNNCVISYNFFNQPTEIAEGDYRLDLYYGANQQRNKAMRYEDNVLENTRYYINKYYEKEIDSTGTARHYHYIYGDNGVVALYISAPKTAAMYYIHTDHLGSYCAITNATKEVRQRNWFDPWGNTIDTTWQTNFALTYRGFTGHEHYPYFNIINMNGRLYDPVIGRFFSPDNFVQTPEFTQGFNRYSYCLNNPMSYIDPSGNSFVESFLNFLTFPARVLSEGFQWINDKINGITRPNGYFNWSYLSGQTEPGAPFKIYAANQVPYGHPFYMEPSAGTSSISLGTGFSLCADNEWNNILHRPTLMKLSKRFLAIACKKLGVDPGKPISEELRTAAFAYAAKNLWFKYAPNPSGGIRLGNIGKNYNGLVQPDSDGEKLLGGSIMFLHKENAFTSLEKLFYTLGHELVHVSQYLALAGLTQKEYKKNDYENALDYYAYMYQHFLGDNYYLPRVDWSGISSENKQKMHYANYGWTYLYFKPF